MLPRNHAINAQLGWNNLLKQHQNITNDDLVAYLPLTLMGTIDVGAIASLETLYGLPADSIIELDSAWCNVYRTPKGGKMLLL